MKIGINGQHINLMPTGPAVYLRHLILALAETDTKNEYYIYTPDITDDNFFDSLALQNPRFKKVTVKTSLSWTQWGLSIELVKNPVDVFFTSVHTLPVIAAMVNKKTKFVSMIHGLEYLTNQSYGLISIKKFLQPIILRTTLYLSNNVIVPSAATADKLIRVFGASIKQKLFIIPEGLNPIYLEEASENETKIIEKYDVVKQKYLIFVSTIQPRKNLPRTIEGFARASKNINGFKLLVIGKKGWNYKDSLEAPKKFGIERQVEFLGPADDVTVKALMCNAKGFVNFSLDEGFGLPLLEAMSTGIPCAVSDIPAFKEIGEDYPIYADPNSVAEITSAIGKIINSPIEEEKSRKQTNHARNYTWHKTARQTLKTLQS